MLACSIFLGGINMSKVVDITDKLDFEEESLDAYNYTLKEFESPKTNEKSNH